MHGKGFFLCFNFKTSYEQLEIINYFNTLKYSWLDFKLKYQRNPVKLNNNILYIYVINQLLW